MAEPLTKDSEAYGILSLDREAKRLVATQIKQDFRLNLFTLDDLPAKTFVADAARAAFAPDGRIYFASTMSGNDEIWSSNQDGTGQRQLTNDPAGDGSPIVSADNKTVFFASNRSGKAQIWRMNVDGSAQTQVTKTEGGAPLFVSPDGKLVYYKHSISAELWSVAIETGEERLVLDKPRSDFPFSPDGLFVAVEEKTEKGLAITVHSLIDRKVVRTFDLANERPRLIEFAWMPDGGAWREVGSLADDDISEASGLSFSPDGKKFTLVQGGWKHDAVMLTGLR
jgi:Tol biopolymer transport system component